MPDKTESVLSPRETEVLNLAAQGLTDNGIANQLSISASTVNSYWVRIRAKLGSHTRTELVCDYLMARSEQTLAALRKENERLQELLAVSMQNQLSSATPEDWLKLSNDSSDAMLVVSPSGKIEVSAPKAAYMFGYAKEEMIGLTIEDLLPPELRRAHAEHRRWFFHDPASRRMNGNLTTAAMRKDGTCFPCCVMLTPLGAKERLFVGCLVRDITAELEDARMQLINKPDYDLEGLPS